MILPVTGSRVWTAKQIREHLLELRGDVGGGARQPGGRNGSSQKLTICPHKTAKSATLRQTRLLLQSHPEAALRRDYNQKLPLHLVVERHAGRSRSHLLKLVQEWVQAFPAAVLCHDEAGQTPFRALLNFYFLMEQNDYTCEAVGAGAGATLSVEHFVDEESKTMRFLFQATLCATNIATGSTTLTTQGKGKDPLGQSPFHHVCDVVSRLPRNANENSSIPFRGGESGEEAAATGGHYFQSQTKKSRLFTALLNLFRDMVQEHPQALFQPDNEGITPLMMMIKQVPKKFYNVQNVLEIRAQDLRTQIQACRHSATGVPAAAAQAPQQHVAAPRRDFFAAAAAAGREAAALPQDGAQVAPQVDLHVPLRIRRVLVGNRNEQQQQQHVQNLTDHLKELEMKLVEIKGCLCRIQEEHLNSFACALLVALPKFRQSTCPSLGDLDGSGDMHFCTMSPSYVSGLSTVPERRGSTGGIASDGPASAASASTPVVGDSLAMLDSPFGAPFHHHNCPHYAGATFHNEARLLQAAYEGTLSAILMHMDESASAGETANEDTDGRSMTAELAARLAQTAHNTTCGSTAPVFACQFISLFGAAFHHKDLSNMMRHFLEQIPYCADDRGETNDFLQNSLLHNYLMGLRWKHEPLKSLQQQQTLMGQVAASSATTSRSVASAANAGGNGTTTAAGGQSSTTNTATTNSELKQLFPNLLLKSTILENLKDADDTTTTSASAAAAVDQLPASSATQTEKRQSSCNKYLSKHSIVSVMQTLLQVKPDMAHTANKRGELPLHLALRCFDSARADCAGTGIGDTTSSTQNATTTANDNHKKKMLLDVVSFLVETNPESCLMTDPTLSHYFLYPFMLAALDHGRSHNTSTGACTSTITSTTKEEDDNKKPAAVAVSAAPPRRGKKRGRAGNAKNDTAPPSSTTTSGKGLDVTVATVSPAISLLRLSTTYYLLKRFVASQELGVH
jgi:hypothetical protein